MPKVKVTTTTDDEYPIAYDYVCECGTPIRLLTNVRHKRLPKCFDCLDKTQLEFDSVKEQRLFKGHVRGSKSKDEATYGDMF